MSEKQSDFVLAENRRVRLEYRRREQETDPELYAHWQPAEMLMRVERKRIAATMLHSEGVFPSPSSECLEVGYGRVGWLGDLITWGVPESRLHGIELDSDRAVQAQALLPSADLRVGDATNLPWPDKTFDLVVVSTVFSSILNSNVRKIVAAEITRVIKLGGALLWYDLAVNNPRNPNVRKVDHDELERLFSTLKISSRPVTLAPPIARRIAPRSWVVATLLQSLPGLRSHRLAVMVRD